MDGNVSIFTAFIAGLFSFLSPCILPLVSSYLLLISGSNFRRAESTVQPEVSKRAIVLSTVCFVLGFTCVFIAMSILVYGFMAFLGGISAVINKVAGVVVILLGLHILFNFIPFLNYEKKFAMPGKNAAGLGAFIAGAAFGAGWTPCVGPILGSILLMASQSGQMSLAVVYLLAYSVGLGVPFLLTAIFWGTFLKYFAKLKPLIPTLRVISGILVVGVGIFMFLGRFVLLNALLFKGGYALAKWAESGTFGVRLFPALIFLFLALIPFVINTARKKPLLKRSVVIFSMVCLVITTLNLIGIINCAALFSKWMAFIGI
ncbi:MAG: cytochrome c biogenesis protein CcdA [Treponema sp.]|jgi:cytochrome c-type biogenesis protein|nr:cytochrome c biogenesis protein CcdA [Treponema sp.]